MDEAEAVASLNDLGLSDYEARVFIGLERLGEGTAREVAEVTDVPRSQVYGAADALAEYGLVDVQRANPTLFRPVSVEEARERLTERLERTADRAFEYVEGVSGEREALQGDGEAVWRVVGGDNVSARVATLAGDASTRVVYGTDDAAELEGAVGTALADAADRGVDVLVTSVEPAVGDAVRARSPDVRFRRVPADRQVAASMGRILLCDHDTVLMSVRPTAVEDVTAETGFWSAGGAFATVLVTISEEHLTDMLGERP